MRNIHIFWEQPRTTVAGLEAKMKKELTPAASRCYGDDVNVVSQSFANQGNEHLSCFIITDEQRPALATKPPECLEDIKEVLNGALGNVQEFGFTYAGNEE